MKRQLRWLVPALAVVALGACGGRHSPIGFRLPETGDAELGKNAFVQLECYRCHTVAGVALPNPTGELPNAVPLGGVVHEIRTDGYLVTAIIHPSHDLRNYPKRELTSEGAGSPMPDYNKELTVRKLVDLVAFLQSRYQLAPPPALHP